ncbi:MAG: 6-phospho-3-hexuloisomerase, partial [Sulfolobales archaeon]
MSSAKNDPIALVKDVMREISSFIMKSIDMISVDQVEKAVKLLVDTYNRGKMVLVMGAGRSGLIGRGFAMRLMHLGFRVYVLGDTIVPPVREGD